MKRLSGREWKTLFTLSIVVPVGFLVAFKLTGILEGPATIAETVTLAPWVWERERPDSFCHFANEIDQMTYQNEEVFLHFTFRLGDYDPHYWTEQTISKPVTYLGLYNLTVAVQSGFVHRLQFNFTEEYEQSVVDFKRVFGTYHNLTLREVFDGQNLALGNNMKCYLNFVSNGEPARVAIEKESLLWSLKSSYNQTHNMEIDLIVTYFNGTAYKELIQPLRLTVYPDDNNSFEDADEVTFGTYEGFIGGGVDNVDFYKIYLYNEDAIEITLKIVGADFNLYLYDPNGIERAKSTSPVVNETEYIGYTADTEGYWFIEIRGSGGTGPYSMSIM